MQDAQVGLEQSKAFYEDYYHKKAKTKRSYRAILKYFRSPGLLLDVACGDGQFLGSLDSHIGKYGCDISEQAIQIAKKNSSEARLVVCSAEQLPFESNYFDYVTCFGSIEHFVNMEVGLVEIKRVGKSYCKYFFVVPNSAFNIVNLTKGKVGTEQAKNIEVLHTLKNWQKIFEDSGYQVEDVHNFPVYRQHWAWLKRIIYLFLPVRLDEQFLFLCKKTKGIE